MKLRSLGCVAVAVLALHSAHAADTFPLCSASTLPEQTCQIRPGEVRPTQFAVGMREVRLKQAEIESLSDKKLEKYLRKEILPAVIGPGAQFHIFDGHHRLRALEEARVNRVYLKVADNWSALNDEEFIERMKITGRYYLFDENGQGPLDPRDLPHTIGALKDDSYRSLAWHVLKRGCYAKADVLYAEFAWADFFRTRVSRPETDAQFEAATTRGCQLAKSPEAAKLPGYIGRL